MNRWKIYNFLIINPCSLPKLREFLDTLYTRSCNQGSRQRRTGEVTISGQKLQLTRGRVVARVQLNKWAINTHTALPSFLHTLKFGRVAKLDDVSLPNSSQCCCMHWFLVNEDECLLLPWRISGDPQIAENRHRQCPPKGNWNSGEEGLVVAPPMKHQHNGRRGVCKSLGVIIVSVQRKRAVPIPGI